MWKRFHFESNLFFDGVEGPDDWKRLRAAYPDLTDDELLASKEATYGGHRSIEERERRPNFGKRIEHDGKTTLRDFFVENNMLNLIPEQLEPALDRAEEKGRQLVGDMPWVTEHLTDDQIEDLKKQVASCLRHFNDELLQWLRKREGELETQKERTPSASKKASLGGQAKAYKDVHQFIEQRTK